MQIHNLPTIGARYWAALILASIFGANCGDFVSHILHLGHWHGLPPLALLFCLVMAAERWSKLATEAYYWIAIVTLRTAATNLGDLATHDFKLDYPLVIAGLVLLLVAVLIVERTFSTRNGGAAALKDARGLPTTDIFYWVAMLTAGTLGTAGGDFVADDLGLGLVWGSIVLCAALAAMLAVRNRPGLTTKSTYWLTVVAVRTAGTTLGDLFASRHGLGLGLTVSTPLMGALMVLLLLLWRDQRTPRTAEAEA